MTKGMDSEETLVRLFGSVSRARISISSMLWGTVILSEADHVRDRSCSPAVQRELENLASLSLVRVQKTHDKVFYAINRDSPFFKLLKEICGLTSKGENNQWSPSGRNVASPSNLGRGLAWSFHFWVKRKIKLEEPDRAKPPERHMFSLTEACGAIIWNHRIRGYNLENCGGNKNNSHNRIRKNLDWNMESRK